MSLKDKTVLIIDDEEDLREIMRVELGAKDVFSKPFEMEKIILQIQKDFVA